MRRLRAWGLRLVGLFARDRRERELEAEIESHLEMHVGDNIRSGMTPAEARRAAILALGGIEQTKEIYRERRGLPMLETAVQDVLFGTRVLRRNPGFATVAVLTLALGIGANTAILSIVNAVLLRPLPFPDSHRLVLIWATNEERGATEDVASYPDFEAWRAAAKSFESMGAFTARGATLSDGEQAELVPAFQATPGLFEVFGVQPVIGRVFSPGEEETGRSHVAVLSDPLWRRRFAARPDVLGRSIRVNEEIHTIVGVMPAGVRLSPDAQEQIYTPLVRDPDRGHGFLRVVARLRRDARLDAAQAEMNGITRRLAGEFPRWNRWVGANVMPLIDAVVGRVRAGLLIFLGVVGFILVIACSNVANLLLARSAARQKELAVRAALGAGRTRLVRQLLTESILLALAGGALGLVLATWTARALAALVAGSFPVPRIEGTQTDAAVLGFALALSLLTGILFGILPALSSVSTDLVETLRESSHTTTSGARGRRLRSALVIGETALALVLLAGAGLLLKTFLVMRRTAPGFRAENLVTVDFWLPRIKLRNPPERLRFFSSVLQRVQGVPGVRSAALVSTLPLGGGSDTLGFRIPGRPGPQPGKQYFSSNFNICSRGYFRTMEIPLRSGREFSESDGPTSPGVVVINQTAAERFWPGETAVGKQILLSGPNRTTLTLTIAGVATDVRQSSLGAAPLPEVFLANTQPGPGWPHLSLVVRTDVDPAGVAETVKSVAARVDPDVPIAQVRTMDEVLAGSLSEPRIYTLLLAAFALLALVLAVVGLYGVVSYTATLRTHEMGIRIALGASRVDILQLVLRQGVGLGLAGMALGMAGAIAVTRVLKNLVRGADAVDPPTFAAVALLLLGVTLAASYLAARRALRVDPVVALRCE